MEINNPKKKRSALTTVFCKTPFSCCIYLNINIYIYIYIYACICSEYLNNMFIFVCLYTLEYPEIGKTILFHIEHTNPRFLYIYNLLRTGFVSTTTVASSRPRTERHDLHRHREARTKALVYPLGPGGLEMEKHQWQKQW